MANFLERAVAEIDGLHRALQAWFGAECAHEPALVLSHFDPGFHMVTPTGKILPFEAFKAAVPGMWGTRKGLVMAITGETVCASGAGWALLTYQERQTLGETVSNRLSTVLLLDRGPAEVLAWRHLQETMIA